MVPVHNGCRYALHYILINGSLVQRLQVRFIWYDSMVVQRQRAQFVVTSNRSSKAQTTTVMHVGHVLPLICTRDIKIAIKEMSGVIIIDDSYRQL
jgi:hypothetical protein